MKLDRETTSALVRLSVFLLATGLATFLLVAVIGNFTFAPTHEYSAEFSDVTGVAKGDDVRIAGVKVGSVQDIDFADRDTALVTFTVRQSTPLTDDTRAELRFRNLVGQRYLVLMQGGEGGASVLEPGSTIGLERTKNALDLNMLLSGFKPVFQALSPEDTNKLAFEIVKTFQGESGNVETLLASTASLTRTLADRDELIGDVITNLSETLDIVGSRDQQLSATIVSLQQLVSGLNKDRGAILGSIDSVSALSQQTANLLVEGRPDLSGDVKELNRLTASLAKPKNLKTLDSSLKILPRKLEKLSNAAASGSMFNFYACAIDTSLDSGIAALDDFFAALFAPLDTASPRCGDRGVS